MNPVEVHHRIDESPDLPPDAPTIVLSNSLGSTVTMWDRQIPALSGVARVVRYDIRGHGRSPVPNGPYDLDDLTDDVVALLDRLALDRVHFVGLSIGGMTGMRLAAREPDRVDRMVVLCTSVRLEPTQGWHDRAATVRSEGAAAVAEAVAGRWYTRGFHERHPDRVADAIRLIGSTPPEGYASCCEAIATMDLRDDLAAIIAPTLAIAGAEDPATPPDHLERIADGVKDGRLLVVPEAAHLANDEQPDVVNPAIIDHLGLRG
ncbi:MAG TPA: 3-oxoadipate enol-lactonase [Nocardioidaceae bacterium]|nr:3-oxoadipate enol-lactonase [Nocardioidaceae bacterium]